MPTTEYGVDQFFQNASTSPKMVYDASGVLGWSPHNMFLRSEDYSVAGWLKETTTITAGQDTAPDGTLTGWKLACSAATAGWYDLLYNNGVITTIAGETYTMSADVKAAGFSWIAMEQTNLNTNFSYFNLTTGTLGARHASHTNHSITSLGNGWYRCTISLISSGAATALKLHLRNADGHATVLTGIIGSGIYVWRTQYNRGPIYTAYLPTTTAARVGLALDYDPVTHAARGLLCEPAATNLALRSGELDSASWTKTSITVGANAITAPSGLLEADAFIPDSGAVTAALSHATLIITVAATVYTFSVYAKNATLGTPWCQLSVASGTQFRAWFDLSTGTKGTSAGSPTAYTITAVGNGWYRLTMTFAAGGTNSNCYVFASPSDGSTGTITGNGVSPAYYFWGMQFEASTVATSYIPTFAATVTRGGDGYGVAPALINYSATAGSWWVEHYQIGGVGTNPRILAYLSAAYLYTTETSVYGISDGTQLTKSGVPTATGNTQRVAFAFQSGDRALTATGLAAATDAGSTALLLAPGANIILGGSGGTTMRGYFRKLRYVPRRKTNTELQTETT